MPRDAHEFLLRVAAAATLQRAQWGDRSVEVPLARPERLDPDSFIFELADGSWLILAAPERAHQARADLRRWAARFEGDRVLALILLDEEERQELLASPPDRPSPGLRVGLFEARICLWDDDWPLLADVLLDAVRRRPPPPADTLVRLESRRTLPWPPRASPAPTEPFEQVVFALAQAHDLVRLVRGEARLRLSGGGSLTVLATTGEPEVDDRALAAAIAGMAPALGREAIYPGLLVVGGPIDLGDRVASILGERSRREPIYVIGPGGAVRPPDSDLRDLIALAYRYQGPRDLWGALEVGLERRNAILSREAEAAGEQRIGLVDGLLDALPQARLRWLHSTLALLEHAGREIHIRWVGPEGGDVGHAVEQWRLAAAAARWTRQSVDLLLVGGDLATWEKARAHLPGAPEGHLYQLGSDEKVRARAGIFGPLQPTVRALKRWLRRPESARQRSLADLRERLEQRAVAEFRAMVADADFGRRLFGRPAWATRLLLLAIALGYLLQYRWEGTTSAGAVRMGALTGEGLLLGEPWRWLAAAFLHASWWHIALNAWALWILGRRLEAMLGPHRFAILFLLSCVGGSMLHEVFSSPGDIAVGASTGVLGILAAQGALVLRRPDLIPDRIRRLLWREAWMNGLLILGISLLPFVGGLAHLGGALTGFGLVFSGVIVIGIRPGTATSPGPTEVVESMPWHALTAIMVALATSSMIAALLIGQPWVLQQPEGRLRDVLLDGGALTVPLPGSAGPPVLSTRPDGTRVVAAGDPLRDGLRIEVEARPSGSTEAVSLEVVRALRGGIGLSWESDTVAAGSFYTATPLDSGEDLLSLVSPEDRLLRRHFLAERDGVLFEVRVTGTSDVVRSRLSGTWKRIPGGLSAQSAAWPTLDPAPDLAAFFALVQDRPLPPLDEVRFEVRTALELASRVRGGEDLPPSALVRTSIRGRLIEIAHALSLHGQTDLALRLLKIAERAAGADETRHIKRLRSSIHEEAVQPDQALAALEGLSVPKLHEAQLHWQAGRPDKARALARPEIDPWWSSAADLAELAMAERRLNRGWARFLAGDIEGCIDDSREALHLDSSLLAARYNLGFCLLAQGDTVEATEHYRKAGHQADEPSAAPTRRAAARDLLRLVRDGVPGAAEQYDKSFGDLSQLPGYAP